MTKTQKAVNIEYQGGIVVDKENWSKDAIQFKFIGEGFNGQDIEGTLTYTYNDTKDKCTWFSFRIGESIHDKVREYLKDRLSINTTMNYIDDIDKAYQIVLDNQSNNQ